MNVKLIAALVMLLVLIGVYFFGRHDGSTACTKDALTEYSKGVEKNVNTAKSLKRLDRPDLNRVLSNWVRPEDHQ